MHLSGKKVLVCGMARSGIAAARLLYQYEAIVTLQDMKTEEELPEAQNLKEEGILLILGRNPEAEALLVDLIVLSPGVPISLPFIQEAKNAGIPIWSEIELASRLTPCPIAAITGTNGKTTTTTLAGALLKETYSNTQIVGNIGFPFSQAIPLLTSKDWVVAEISSFQMEGAVRFAPHISAVLNITEDHLNRHKTMDTYIAMKERIFANQISSDICILNHADPICRKMAEKCKARIFFFSSKEILADGVFLENQSIWLSDHGKKTEIIAIDDLQILGTHNVENAMAATAIAYFAGISIPKIRRILQEFKGVAHRIEYVATIDGVDYYNDSKGTNPDASIRAVMAMKKPILLIGGGYDKEADFSEWVSTFQGRVKGLALIGETAPSIEVAARNAGFSAITLCETFSDAITTCKELAQPGDCVLLSPACASWGMFHDYEERGDCFKAQVLSYLHS